MCPLGQTRTHLFLFSVQKRRVYSYTLRNMVYSRLLMQCFKHTKTYVSKNREIKYKIIKPAIVTKSGLKSVPLPETCKKTRFFSLNVTFGSSRFAGDTRFIQLEMFSSFITLVKSHYDQVLIGDPITTLTLILLTRRIW